MKDHSLRAAELFVNGCNCSQAVFVAFAEDCGIDEKTGNAVVLGVEPVTEEPVLL